MLHQGRLQDPERHGSTSQQPERELSVLVVSVRLEQELVSDPKVTPYFGLRR